METCLSKMLLKHKCPVLHDHAGLYCFASHSARVMRCVPSKMNRHKVNASQRTKLQDGAAASIDKQSLFLCRKEGCRARLRRRVKWRSDRPLHTWVGKHSRDAGASRAKLLLSRPVREPPPRAGPGRPSSRVASLWAERATSQSNTIAVNS